MINEIEILFLNLKNEKNKNYRLIKLKDIRIKLMTFILNPNISTKEFEAAKNLLGQIEICLN